MRGVHHDGGRPVWGGACLGHCAGKPGFAFIGGRNGAPPDSIRSTVAWPIPEPPQLTMARRTVWRSMSGCLSFGNVVLYALRHSGTTFDPCMKRHDVLCRVGPSR